MTPNIAPSEAPTTVVWFAGQDIAADEFDLVELPESF